MNDTTLGTIVRAVASGQRRPELLRACTELMLQAKRDSISRSCATFALDLGQDSAWHELRLARIAARQHDTTDTTLHFALGLLAAKDSAALADVMWHLQWFFSPEELERFRAVPVSQLSAWVQLRLVSRDMRDGRPQGSRLIAHFERMEYVFEHYTLGLPEQIRKKGGLVGSMPDKPGNAWTLLSSPEPGGVGAGRFRYYARWQTDIDDRGIVYMRFGKPDTLLALNVPNEGLGRHGGGLTDNLRELWIYHIDDRRLFLSFEGEQFDGREEATRLVSGVLGSYMCGFDARRCLLTRRSQLAAAKEVGEANPLPYEQMLPIQYQDTEFIRTATTRDDNSPRGLTSIPLAATLYRMWDPTSGAPLSVIPIRTSGDTSRMTVRVSQLDIGSSNLRDTTLTVPSSSVLALPRGPDVSTWSVVATREAKKETGRGWEDGLAPLPVGEVRMSDLILGTARSPLVWDATGSRVPIHLGPFDRKVPIKLYYQLFSKLARPNATSTITLIREDPGTKADAPSVRIEGRAAVEKGLTEVERELDVSRLDGHRYRLEVAVSDGAGSVRVRQAVRIELK
ncbi:MAG: hypothetical protein ABIZ70_12790 [Gemmatimonadales bacterium]